MRHLLTALCAAITLAFAAPAFAQGKGETGQTANAAAPADADLVTAYEGVFRLFLYDSGIFDRIVAQALPAMRDRVQQSDAYQRATPAHRAALAAFVETLPDVLRQEVDAIVPTMAANAAQRVQGVLNAAEVNSYVAFLNRDEMHGVFAFFIENSIRNPNAPPATPELTTAQIAAFNEYSQTPEGRVVIAHNGELIEAMTAQFDATQATMSGRLAQRMREGTCQALGDECRTFGFDHA